MWLTRQPRTYDRLLSDWSIIQFRKSPANVPLIYLDVSQPKRIVTITRWIILTAMLLFDHAPLLPAATISIIKQLLLT